MSEKFPKEGLDLDKKEVDELGADIIAKEEEKNREIVKKIIDQGRNSQDKGEIPLGKEITEMLNGLIRGRRFELVRSLDDEEGPFIREITVKVEGGTAEYQYMRKGSHAQNLKSLTTNVTVTSYDNYGMPVGGEVLARYHEGKWNLTE